MKVTSTENKERTKPKTLPKKLKTMTGNTLLETPFEPLAFSIEKILPQGVFIFAGSGKIGKSWLSLDMCISVATGTNMWHFNTNIGEVLYLALEDTFPRLQGRINLMQEENIDISNLHLATASLGISDGLIDQIKNFIEDFPNTKLIVIDTLERIRNTNKEQSLYSYDYQDMTKLREITDTSKVTLLLVHHTRKMFDPDPLNTLSGSTGLVGAVDGVWVLEKEARVGSKAKLTIANRDTEGYCFNLDFEKENCKWSYIGDVVSEEDKEADFCVLIDDFVGEYWQGTATNLCEELKKINSNFEMSALSITKKLNSMDKVLKAKYKIDIVSDRNKSKRLITLFREK